MSADAPTYAAGLLEASDDPAQTWRELGELTSVLASVPQLKQILIDLGTRDEDDRRKGIERALKFASLVTRRLADLLVAGRQLELIPEIVRSFEAGLVRRGYRRVTIETPQRLNASDKQELLEALDVPADKLLLSEITNKALLAGVRVTIDGREVDYSVGGRLDQMVGSLSQAGGS